MESALMKDILSIIPPLSFSSHKGSSGRIGIIGGCKEYTGAPYFAAISALKVGCDLAHVFCTQDAAPVIKTYSPELIVYPILDSLRVQEEFYEIIPRLHSVVMGPGLGRNLNSHKTKSNLEIAEMLITVAKVHGVPLVLDADALFYITDKPNIIRGYKKAILTPNKVEFGRLYNAVCEQPLSGDATEQDVQHLSKVLGNVTIVHKGPEDIISDGINTVVCTEPGSPRRCGGQGDLLSGSMGVFNYWAHNFYSNETESNTRVHSLTIIAALAACRLTRKCNYLAFSKFKRSMLTSNMVEEIHTAFSTLFSVD